jgi:hypothetical protein
MRPRISAALGLSLALLAAPLAGVLCETRCAGGETPAAAAAPGSCHRETPADDGPEASLAAGHGCAQHAALPAVPALKTDSGRAFVKDAAAATAVSSSALVAHSAARPPVPRDLAAPPAPGLTLNAPLRV